MNELIKITEQNGKKAVSARELHTFLESKQEFASWIKNRIEKYGFIENQDYEVFDNFIKNPSGGRPLTEYALTTDCAKEISMVEGNDKGKIARQYFIEQDKKAIQLSTNFQVPQTFADALRLAAKQAEQIEEAKKQLEAQKPAVVFHESVSASNTVITMGDLAKLICQNGIEIGEHRLYSWMVENKFLICRKRWSKSKNRYENDYMPYQRFVEMGLFFVSENVIQGAQEPFIKHTVKIAGKGQAYFVSKFLSKKAA